MRLRYPHIKSLAYYPSNIFFDGKARIIFLQTAKSPFKANLKKIKDFTEKIDTSKYLQDETHMSHLINNMIPNANSKTMYCSKPPISQPIEKELLDKKRLEKNKGICPFDFEHATLLLLQRGGRFPFWSHNQGSQYVELPPCDRVLKKQNIPSDFLFDEPICVEFTPDYPHIDGAFYYPATKDSNEKVIFVQVSISPYPTHSKKIKVFVNPEKQKKAKYGDQTHMSSLIKLFTKKTTETKIIDNEIVVENADQLDISIIYITIPKNIIKPRKPIPLNINSTLVPFPQLTETNHFSFVGDGSSSIPFNIIYIGDLEIVFKFSTPLSFKNFTLFVNGIFQNGLELPMLSPLFISREDIKYQIETDFKSFSPLAYQIDYLNSYDHNRFTQPVLNSKLGNGELEFSINLSHSGSGFFKFGDITFSLDGYDYQLAPLEISVVKKNPIVQTPIDGLENIFLMSELEEQNILNPSGDYTISSREELFQDILRVQSGELLYLKSQLFINFSFSDIASLELEESIKIEFEKNDLSRIIIVEYLWTKSVSQWKAIHLVNRGFSCPFNSPRNKFCPFCPRVNHRLSKSEEYLVYSVGESLDLDYGLTIELKFSQEGFSMFMEDFNIKKRKEKFLSPGISLAIQDCYGYNVSYSSFINSSCQEKYLSCSNFKLLESFNIETKFVNDHYNKFSEKTMAPGIKYDGDLKIEYQQKTFGVFWNISLNLIPLVEPKIREVNYSISEEEFFIKIKYTIENYGLIKGIVSYKFWCDSFSISIFSLELIVPKDKTAKTNSNRCYVTSQLQSNPLWSNLGKEISSTISFDTINEDLETKCKGKSFSCGFMVNLY
ncbi:hypothetical protein CYY_002503 [Polysphondylium violaceum]|uniref:Uncharacterized protein n=1 Tax=Polysphondylium violaceum TaxID=133409 RepID=A0A8J4PW93_9MYCE|nr:hypothetical protein CYY_002503 [Polysphondylium violaceum]